MEKKSISRRSFLKLFGAGTVAATATLAGCKKADKAGSQAAEEPGVVKLADGNGFCVNGKSLLGALATIEWATLYCVSEDDIYFKIEKFCV